MRGQGGLEQDRTGRGKHKQQGNTEPNRTMQPEENNGRGQGRGFSSYDTINLISQVSVYSGSSNTSHCPEDTGTSLYTINITNHGLHCQMFS